MKKMLGLIVVATSFQTAFAARIQGHITGGETKSLTVMSVKCFPQRVVCNATLASSQPPVSPVQPPNQNYNVELDLKDEGDIATYHLLLRAHGGWNRVKLSSSASGQITGVEIGSGLILQPIPINPHPTPIPLPIPTVTPEPRS
jgi:hypothetical protein